MSPEISLLCAGGVGVRRFRPRSGGSSDDDAPFSVQLPDPKDEWMQESDLKSEGFGELHQTRAAIFVVVGALVVIAVANLVIAGWSSSSTTSVIIDALLVSGLLSGRNWGRVWTLVRAVLGMLVFGGLAIYQNNLIAALLQVGLLGPIVILLTGRTTRMRLAVGLGVLLVAFGGFVALNSVTISVLNLRPGDCFDLPDGTGVGAVTNLTRVDCESAHDVEVFAVAEYPSGGGGYPSESEFISAGRDLCLSRFEDFVGVTSEETVLAYYVVYPSRESWIVNNDRSVACGVFNPAGEKLVGSVDRSGGEPLAGTAVGAGLSTGLDMLEQGCLVGSMADCDMLYFNSAVESDYRNTARTCGDRNEPLGTEDGGCQVYHEDLTGLWSALLQCDQGFFPACDMLTAIFADDQSVSGFTSSCAERRVQESGVTCTNEFGVGTRKIEAGGATSDATNLALRQPATASSSDGTQVAARAVDGNDQTTWNSGGYAPHWIDVDLGEASTVYSVSLMTSQLPAGQTVHVVLGRGPGEVYVPLFVLDGATSDAQWLTYEPETPWTAVRSIRVLTVSSPSWIAWREIEVMGAHG